MRWSPSSRLGLVCTLLLGLGLGSLLPIVLEADHYLEHGSHAAGDEGRMVLRAVDGDHRHEVAHFEAARHAMLAPCSLCALLGKVHVLAAGKPRLYAGLESHPALPADAVRPWAGPRRGPEQPRAPPGV